MKTILITGFDPFGGESINPAWEAVKNDGWLHRRGLQSGDSNGANRAVYIC